MVFVFSGALLFFSVISYLKYNYIFNPITSMFILWAIILPLSYLNLYGVSNPEDKVYYVIFVGLLSFGIGAVIGSYRYKIVLNKSKRKNKGNWNYPINYKFLYIISSIVLVYYLYQLFIVVGLLINGHDYSYIRDLVTSSDENELRSSSIITIVRVFLAEPITYLIIALLPIDIFFGKRDFRFIILAISLMILFVVTTGGRSVIKWIAIYFIFSFTLSNKKSNRQYLNSKKSKIIFSISLVLMLAFLYFMTKARKGDDVDFARQCFIYFIAPVKHFDYYINVVDNSGLYGYGLSSFYGVIYPFLFLLKTIGLFSKYPDFVTNIHYMSFEMMESGVNLGNNVYMNAFVTTFYQPYLDGRVLGVILIMGLFGFVSNRLFIHAYYYDNIMAILLYSLLLQKIFSSYVRFYFTQQSQALCFMFGLIIFESYRFVFSKRTGRFNGIDYYSNLQ